MRFILKTVLAIILAWFIIVFVLPALLIIMALVVSSMRDKPTDTAKQPPRHIEYSPTKDIGLGK
jgi:flagellar basal body-associated protein FliL